MPTRCEDRDPDLDPDLELALRLADAADAIGLRHFTGDTLDHETKPDGSPVSDADLEIERTLRSMVAAERPGDGFLGEEVGPSSGQDQRRWIVDGIDGTVLFVAGREGWATEIALEIDGLVVLGVSTCPSLGRRWWARRGGGAWRSVSTAGLSDPPDRIAVSAHGQLAAARSTAIPPLAALGGEERRLAERLTAPSAEYVPPREHGALMVADGRAEVCLQAGGGPWDFAALAVIVEEAGGRFSNLTGGWVIDDGGPVVYSNGRVHEEALRTVRR
jgi:histidinol-phosphatase